MLAVTLPWTYWMALPMLVTAALVLVGFVGLYLKRVVEPSLWRRDHLEAVRAVRDLDARLSTARQLPSSASRSRRNAS